jgi:methionyl-tRNA formyltransferase
MKLAFCTCVQLGLSCISEALNSGYNFDLLITLNDNKSINKSGRVFLDKVAEKYNIPLLKINHINEQVVKETIIEKKIDWLFIIGWSQIASSKVINACLNGVIGAHPTLLPEGRGRASIPWAIIKGLKKTGVTFFRMDLGVDTGPILAQYEITIGKEENATDLYQKVNNAHIEIIKNLLPILEFDKIEFLPQDETKATYWEGRTPEDGKLNFEMTCEEAHRIIRATTRPYPGAFIYINEKKHIIWSGRLGKGGLMELVFIDGIYSVTDFEIV